MSSYAFIQTHKVIDICAKTRQDIYKARAGKLGHFQSIEEKWVNKPLWLKIISYPFKEDIRYAKAYAKFYLQEELDKVEGILRIANKCERLYMFISAKDYTCITNHYEFKGLL